MTDEQTTTDFDLVVMEEVNCAHCGIRFGIPAQLLAKRREDHEGFWCPNGHRLAYSRPPKERDVELEEAVEAARIARDELAAERAAHEQTRATKRPLFRRTE